MAKKAKKRRQRRRRIIVVIRAGTTGYRAQLDRTRRLLARVLDYQPRSNHIDYQDDVWAFFQNCWHLKDWIKNDTALGPSAKRRIIATCHASTALGAVCRDFANVTKHLKLRRTLPPRAAHAHLNVRMYTVDCQIDTPTGQRSARDVAQECFNEWVQILTAENLPTDPQPI